MMAVVSCLAGDNTKLTGLHRYVTFWIAFGLEARMCGQKYGQTQTAKAGCFDLIIPSSYRKPSVRRALLAGKWKQKCRQSSVCAPPRCGQFSYVAFTGCDQHVPWYIQAFVDGCSKLSFISSTCGSSGKPMLEVRWPGIWSRFLFSVDDPTGMVINDETGTCSGTITFNARYGDKAYIPGKGEVLLRG